MEFVCSCSYRLDCRGQLRRQPTLVLIMAETIQEHIPDQVLLKRLFTPTPERLVHYGYKSTTWFWKGASVIAQIVHLRAVPITKLGVYLASVIFLVQIILFVFNLLRYFLWASHMELNITLLLLPPNDLLTTYACIVLNGLY